MNNRALVQEIQNLRRDLADLTARVLQLESEAGAGGSELQFSSPQTPLVINYTGGALPVAAVPPFPELVTTSPTTSSLPPSASQSGSAPLPSASQSGSALLPSASQSGSALLPLSEAERLLIAQEAGRFLRRCLNGEIRGTSGRERIGLSSRYYILIRDYVGHFYNPVEVHRTFATIKPLVKRGSDCGTSVFIGWPSLQEAKACVAAAELTWPDAQA